MKFFLHKLYRVRTGHGKPGKSWSFTTSFPRPRKSWNLSVGHGKSWNLSMGHGKSWKMNKNDFSRTTKQETSNE